MLAQKALWTVLRRGAAWAAWLVLGLAWLLQPGMAGAEPRIGLVIGNSHYQHVQPLDNAQLDARLIAQTLGQVGFDMTVLIDGDQRAMKEAVADFGRKLRAAGPDAVGLFYYAGHGVQSGDVNYLLPVDAAVRDEADLDLVSVQADWVLRQLFSARNRTNVVILDACRNNPFKAIAGLRQQGLAEMNAPTGTFIAYSSAPGAVALDGVPGTNSPFTGALSAAILDKGQPIEQVFKQVRVSVVAQTQGRQTPWDSSSMTSEFYFNPADPVDPREVAAQELWASARKSGDPVQIVLFLQKYPDSTVSNEARLMLEELLQLATKPTPGAPSPSPSPAVTAQPTPAPPPQPSAQENQLIGRAQSSGAAQDYQAYLQAYPTGTYAALADAEIRALELLEQPAAPAPAPATPAPAPTPAPTPTPAAPQSPQEITFLTPLTQAGPVQGRSISQIILGSPQYPPVEGLPESYWKEKTCSNCHHWTQPTLCEQGKTYLTQSGEFALGKHHPIDGFKQVLRDWASEGCR